MPVFTVVLLCSASVLIVISLVRRWYLNFYSDKTNNDDGDNFDERRSNDKAIDDSMINIKGPTPLPIIGSLHLLRGYSNPFEGFTAMAKTYGHIYRLRLGSLECVVVNNYEAIKDVLMRRGNQFGGRPDYIRYNKLFGGDRNNCKLNLFHFFFFARFIKLKR